MILVRYRKGVRSCPFSFRSLLRQPPLVQLAGSSLNYVLLVPCTSTRSIDSHAERGWDKERTVSSYGGLASPSHVSP